MIISKLDFMKKAYLPLIVILFLPFVSLATKHIVTVANYQFTPLNIPNVFVGDTIRWQWTDGSHTTTCNQNLDPSTAYPAGAATWNSAISATNPSFEYKVTVAGFYIYVCLPHTPDMVGTFTASVVSPVKFSSFSLVANKEKVQLKWTSENEVNVDHYSIRRSTTGADFLEIANLKATEYYSLIKNYSFYDTKLEPNQTYYYYNIAAVDKDGQQTFSETKLYKNETTSTKLIIAINPNPITSPGHVNLTFNANKQGKMDVTIIDNQGKVLIQTTMQAYMGVNKGHIHLGEQPAGTYTILCNLNGLKEVHKIIYK